jgi:ribose transport system substrate-binding protein
MSKARHFGAAIAALAVAAALTACGSNSSSSSGGSASTSGQTSTTAGVGSRSTAKKNYNITFVAALVNDSYFVTIKCGALAEAKKLGINLKWTGPTTNDVSAEIQAFNAASLTNPDGMVLAPFSNTGFGGVVRPLMTKGTPVVASGETLDPPDALTTFITNFLTGGNSLAAEVGKLTGGTGTMGIVADTTGNKTDSDRYTGLIPILHKQYPNLNVLTPQYGQNSSAKAASITSALITGNPNLKLVYASSGPEAVGAASAIAAAHDTGKIKLMSFDSSPPQITLLKQNQLAATVAQSPFLDGELTVKAVVEYLNAHPNKSPVTSSAGLTYTPQKLLTPANVNTPTAASYQYLTSCANAPSGSA